MDFLAGQDVLSYLRENLVIIRPQLVLILWGLAILCVVPLLRTNRTTYPLLYSLLGLLIAGFDVWWGSEAGPAFNGMISFDYFTRYFHLLFIVTAVISVLLSYRYLEIEDEHHGEYYALILFATAGMDVHGRSSRVDYDPGQSRVDVGLDLHSGGLSQRKQALQRKLP